MLRFSRLRLTCQTPLTKKPIMEKNSLLRLQESAIRIHCELSGSIEEPCWLIKVYQSNPEYLVSHCALAGFQEIPILYSVQTAVYVCLLLDYRLFIEKSTLHFWHYLSVQMKFNGGIFWMVFEKPRSSNDYWIIQDHYKM